MKYTIPTMREISEINKNGYKVISTFSGCGGSCLGMKMAGFDVVWANEFIPSAQETYRLNHSTFLDTKDIREVKVEDILKQANLTNGELDIFEGSPPCACFSRAGVKNKGWNVIKEYSGTKQRVDDLFYEFIRLLRGLQPKIFIAENVAGLTEGVAKGYFINIMNELKESGYNVESRIINAYRLGVPQIRKRLFFIGTRKDLNIKPVFPTPHKEVYGIVDLFPYIREVKYSGFKDNLNYKPSTYPSPPIMQSDPNRAETAYFSGGGWCKTIDGVSRKFTIDELKKICSFPSDFKLTGTREEQWERLGRAVPPIMMRNIAYVLKELLDGIKEI